MKVEQTTEYDRFKTVSGNRNIQFNHLKRLVMSIQEKNLLHAVPLIVNENFEIIDGQHRLAAARQLKVPVYYIQIEGLGISDIQRLNTYMRNWISDDYLDSYVRAKNPEYIKLKDFRKKFNLKHSAAMEILISPNVSGFINKKRDVEKEFRLGNFKFTQNTEALENIMNKFVEIGKNYESWCRRTFIRAYLKLLKNPVFVHEEFIGKLEQDPGLLQDCTSIKRYVTHINDIYNTRRRDKVFFS